MDTKDIINLLPKEFSKLRTWKIVTKINLKILNLN
jgi:hypothetical protein